MFKNIADSLKTTYNTDDNVVDSFFNRVLKESISYQRVSGFFSSKALALYATGLENLAQSGGQIKFIISTQISQEDFIKIKKGYQLREALNLKEEKLNEKDEINLGNLAYMIGHGQADVKFAVKETGLFHSKWGYFEDKSGDDIYFIGSNNETGSGMVDNYEDFDVDVSWDTSTNVRERIKQKKDQFRQLWNNLSHEVHIIKANDLLYDMIKQYDAGHIQSLHPKDNFLLLNFKNNEVFFEDRTKKLVSRAPSFFRKIVFYGQKENPMVLRNNINYKQIEDLIEIIRNYANEKSFQFFVSDSLRDFLKNQSYSIEAYRSAGLMLKAGDSRWNANIEQFSEIVNGETSRPLKAEQLRAAYFFYIQKRAANFSVPGSGKTATMLGVFAYLNRAEHKKIKRLLVICPLNAYSSWQDEFKAVFKDKKKLKTVTSKSGAGAVISNWASSNLVLINYQSLESSKFLDALIDGLKKDGQETMLIFDEVHNIKGIKSIRASKALQLPSKTEYRYVLTGTPLPNGYIDIWNFLNILYPAEYDNYFGMSKQELKKPGNELIRTINDKLAPFFWRTNKKQLGVPEAEPDKIIEVPASPEQIRLADVIYDLESNPLAVMIRLMQLSTNPQLLTKAFDLDDEQKMLIDSSGNMKEDALNKLRQSLRKNYLNKVEDIDLDQLEAPKFKKGIELVKNIVGQGRKVIVWALFVDTIEKITANLKQSGIQAVSAYGVNDSDDRDQIIETFKQQNDVIQVLVTNPNTLGESMSLQMAVHDAVYFEYNFNLTFMLQSRDRIHRLGLSPTDKTRYWYLMTTSKLKYGNFIDKKIYDRLKEKEMLMLNAIDQQTLKPNYSKSDREEIAEIIRSEQK